MAPLARFAIVFMIIATIANTAYAQLSESEAEIDAQIQVTWSRFLYEIGQNNAVGAAQLLRPSIRSQYLDHFKSMGDGLHRMADGWSEIKAVRLTESMSEYTIFNGKGVDKTMYFLTFTREADGDWLIAAM